MTSLKIPVIIKKKEATVDTVIDTSDINDISLSSKKHTVKIVKKDIKLGTKKITKSPNKKTIKQITIKTAKKSVIVAKKTTKKNITKKSKTTATAAKKPKKEKKLVELPKLKPEDIPKDRWVVGSFDI